MQIHTENYGKTAELRLQGKFVFDTFKPLRDACMLALDDSAIERIRLELSQVEYLDSSALGMLLLVKEKASKLGKDVHIKGAKGIVMDVLEVAKFKQMFEFQN